LSPPLARLMQVRVLFETRPTRDSRVPSGFSAPRLSWSHPLRTTRPLPKSRRSDEVRDHAQQARVDAAHDPVALRMGHRCRAVPGVKRAVGCPGVLGDWHDLPHARLAEDLLEELAPDAEFHVLTAWDGDQLRRHFPCLAGRRLARVAGGSSWGPGRWRRITSTSSADRMSQQRCEPDSRRCFSKRAEAWDMLEFDSLAADTGTAYVLASEFAKAGLPTSCSLSAVLPVLRAS